VPDVVPWTRLAEALNYYFMSATGRGLTVENLHCLCEKVVRATVEFPENVFVSYAQFCKDPLPNRVFTFWEWFYAALKLTKDHLAGPWKDDLVVGFINKQNAENQLISCPQGTFLLRFSDSELGE